MNQNTRMFLLAFAILTLIVAVILGFAAAPSNPITWLLLAALIGIPFIYKKIENKQYVEWKDEYSVGINSIDQQHKKLLNLINQLQTAITHSTGEEFEREALDALVDYTRTHFTYEEGLMEQNGYPDYEPHKKQHEAMVKEVEKVLSEYQKDQETAMTNAVTFLRDWLINHINGTDKKYSEYLIGKGVK